jgi:hypothetical protein
MPKRSLIVYGGWKGHEPDKVAEIMAKELRAEGWKVDLSDTLDSFADAEKLQADYDLLTPIWTMGELPQESWKGLDAAVRSGVGCGGFHGGMGDAFRSHTMYNMMVGGQFVSHPGGIKRHTVHFDRPRDPICAGLSDFELVSEQYYMHVDPAIEILASTVYSPPFGNEPFVAGTVMPVAWKKCWGNGRVFFSALGHNAKDFDTYEVRELNKRGMMWAAR